MSEEVTFSLLTHGLVTLFADVNKAGHFPIAFIIILLFYSHCV